MRDLALLLRQVRFTNRSFWRNPAAAFFTFAFPLMFLVIFTTVFGSGRVRVGPGAEVSTSTFYIPAIAAFSVITACYTNLAVALSFQREQGVLKRVRGTPMPAWAYLGARVVHAVLVAVLLVAIVGVFGAAFFDATVTASALPAFLLTLALGAAAFCALGLAVTALVPNADAAPAVVNASILPLLFISNVFIPLEDPPVWLDVASKVFPVRHFAEAMLASFFPVPGEPALRAGDLLVLAAWGAAGAAFALRFFSWEPRR